MATKNFCVIMLGLFFSIVVSCAGNKDSFVKQKFTNLKQIDSGSESTEKEGFTDEEMTFDDSDFELDKVNSDNVEDVDIPVNDPSIIVNVENPIEKNISNLTIPDSIKSEVALLQSHIDSGDTIIFSIGERNFSTLDRTYFFENPKIENGNLTGNIIALTHTPEKYFKINVKTYSIITDNNIKIDNSSWSIPNWKKIAKQRDLEEKERERELKHANRERSIYKKRSPIVEKWLEGKDFTYTESLDNKHYKASRRSFRGALFWLAIGIIPLLISLQVIPIVSSLILSYLILLIVLTCVGFGMFLVTRAMVAMRRFYVERNEVIPKKAKRIRTLMILWFMLIGSIPFLIPFLIFIVLMQLAAEKEPTSY